MLVLLVAVVTGAWAQQPVTTYTVTMDDGKVDADKWTVDPTTATTDGVAEGTKVTLTYSGRRKVKSITATAGSAMLSTPLTLEALTDGTIVVSNPQDGMQYSKNGGTKTAVTADAISVVKGDKIAFYGKGTDISSYFTINGDILTNTSIAGGTAEVKAYGNIMSLVDETGFATNTKLTAEQAFLWLFGANTTLTDASELQLPATTLTAECYESMFYGCTSLTTAPALPATTLTQYCYSSMFNGCASLTTAPELPATTLAKSCYNDMFDGCTSLTTAPALPATTLAQSCYYKMFIGCTSLTTAPELPATTLAQDCYSTMFYDCTSLTTAPALPVTTLTESCYAYMFQGCTSLTTAPALPATTLTNSCYSSMFKGCTSLTTAPVLPATTLTGFCYQYMFDGCTSLTTVTCLATDINASNCVLNWLKEVAATGTFYKAASMSSWQVDSPGGIPTGWTTQDYSE